MSDEVVKLNIGAGATSANGWTPIDRKLGSEAYPLDYPDDSVDEIRASHVLEHFDFKEAMAALRDWVRVLKPNGTIKIAVPDFERISTADRLWCHYLMGGQTDENDYHKSVFNRERLAGYMREAGLDQLQTWEPNGEIQDTASHPVSLRIQGKKTPKKLNICALMSIPRLGWNDHFECIADALLPFGIAINPRYGAFWGPTLQRGLEDCIDQGVDLVICTDYDSMFSAAHVQRLLMDFADCPDADAMAGFQSKRGTQSPLGGGDGEVKLETTPHKVKTAHFGLTVIKLNRLADVPKPWFLGVPNEKGEWREGRVDDDIYFWQKWAEAGRTVYITPAVRIGHLEVVVSQFNENLEFEQLTVDEWKIANRLMHRKGEKNEG